MKPPAFRFRSLQARIVVVFLALLLTVQVAGYAFIHNAITDNARRHAQAELAVGERVFGQLLAQSAQRLAQAAQALVGDFALREAVATRDRPAVGSILRRHHERAGADLAMVVGANGRLLADATAPRAGPVVAEPVARLVARAAHGERAPGVELVGDGVYQLVAVRIGQAAPLGWVVIGRRLDERVTKDLAALTSVDVSIAARDGAQTWQFVGSSRPAERRDALLAALSGSPAEAMPSALAAGADFESLVVPLGAGDGVTAVLQRSLAEATAPFRGLQTTLLALTVIGLVLSAIGSVVMARRISKPLGALVDAARKMEDVT